MNLKRLTAAVCAALLTLSLSACGGSNAATGGTPAASQPAGAAQPAPAGEEKVLNIYTWATYFPDDILAEFTERTGVRINYSVFDSNEEMMMKLEAGGDYDLVLASDYIIDTARKENLLLPLDKSQIPNYGNINPAFQGKFYDEQNEYTIPYSAGIPLIIYNPDLVGDVEIKGYEDLWNPAFADSIVVMDDARNVIGLTLKTLGKSLNETDPAVLEQAREKLLTLKPNIRALDYNNPQNLMISGETAVGYIFTSQIITVLNELPDFKVVFPREGLGFGIDSCFIPAKAPHPGNAHAFLDFILDGERSARITDQIYYISCNSAAAPYLANQALVIPEDAIEGAEFMMDVGETADLYNQIWTEFKQS